MHVNQAPLANFLAVYLSFHAACDYGGTVFAHCPVKYPVEFRPGFIAAYVNRYGMRLKIARREHAAHYVLKDMLLDGIKAALFAERIDKRDLGRVGPDLREYVQINRVYSFHVPIDEVMNCPDIRGRPGIRLRSNAHWEEERDDNHEDIIHLRPILSDCRWSTS